MKQVKLTNDKIEDLNRNGYTFTRSYYYWKVLDGTNIVNRITRAEFMVVHGVEQVRIYKRGD